MRDAKPDDMAPRLTVEIITPAVASDLITRTRPAACPNETATKLYAEAMRQGHWVLNGMPLIFSKTGVLLDGVCRLKACIASGCSFVTIVAQNIADDVLHTIDQQRRRQFSCVLESRGERYARTLQEALGKLIRYDDGAMLKQNYPVPWARLDRTLVENPRIRDAVKLAMEHPAKQLNATARCVLAFMGMEASPADLRRFLDAVAYPDRFDAAEPGAVIRTILESQRGQAKADPVKVLALCIKALNATLAPPAEHPRFYRWIRERNGRSGEDFPLLEGYAGLKGAGAQTIAHAAESSGDASSEASLLKIEIASETITPDVAEHYLRNNSKNRAIIRVHVDSIARDIRAGAWLLNAQPICFSETHRLLNGQHRLSACILADHPIEVFVIRGLPDAAYDTYDLHPKKPPSLDDLIGNTGDKNAVQAAASMLWRSLRGPGSHKERPTSIEVRKTLSQHPDLLKWRHYARRNQALGRMSTLMYIAHKLDEDSPTLAPRFLEKLETGAGLSAGDPILELRNRLMRLRANRRRTDQGGVIELINSYWDRYRRSQSMNRAKKPDPAGLVEGRR